MSERAAGGDPDRLVRRTPYSANPDVGPRGRRTQQRILIAAKAVFGDEGFYGASIDRITRQAGCSRVAFYQYFSGKGDVLAHLASEVSRQAVGATDALALLTPDLAGRDALYGWVERYAEIYSDSVAVFRVFDSAAEHDEQVSALRQSAGEYAVSRLRSKLDVGGLSPRELDAVVTVLLDAVRRTLNAAALLRTAAPMAYPPERIHAALADVIHRTVFGRLCEANDGTAGTPPPELGFSAQMAQALIGAGEDHSDRRAGNPATRELLLSTGRDVLSARGYYACRIDDIASASGLSHGVFYRYFANLAELTHVLVMRAIRPIAAALQAIPTSEVGSAHHDELRQWLRDYNATHAHEAEMIRVWVDASLHDADWASDGAAAIDWARRTLESFLAPRGFGDTAVEALVMVALLEAFGAHQRSVDAVDSITHVVERGLLGLPG